MAKRKTKGSILSLAELRASKHLGTPGQITCVPFRSDMLNLFTGGGVKFGHVTEVSGPPGMFKSTTLAEVAGAALTMDAHVVIHDKERKLTAGRFSSLGVKGADKKNPKFWYHEDLFPDYIVTLERMFEDMHEIVASIRRDDFERLSSTFESGNASAELCDRYSHLVDKTRPKVADKKKMASWQKKLSEKLQSPAQMMDDERTPIVWIVDSVTAIPCDEEAIDKDTGKPNLKPSMALNARVWSTLFRTCGFIDNKVAVLHIAQLRTAGIGHGQTAYKKSAVASANEFYATNRIKFFPRKDGALYRDPNQPDSILIGKSANEEQKTYQIGRIIMAAIDKNLEGVSTSVPIYMLASTGTDVINSMFEFLKMNGLLENRGAYYTWTEKFWPERSGETFLRADFTSIYLDAQLRIELYDKLIALKERIKYGRQEAPRPAQPAPGPR